jgi:agmatinase
MRPKDAFVGLVALPFETTTSFLTGTKEAPDAILSDLAELDTYDISFGWDPFSNVAKSVFRPYSSSLNDPFLEQAYSAKTVSDILASGGFPISLGGEHTVSIGPIRAARTRGPLGVVHIDAHADLRNMYEGSYFSHACVMRRTLEMDCRIIEIGVRTMCEEEAAVIEEKQIPLVDGYKAATTDEWYGVVNTLPNRVYLTIDMDGITPRAAPSVGTPEPGGPNYARIVDFLTYLFKEKEVIAADIVELMPGERDKPTIRLASRLLSTIVALKFPAP